MSSLPANFGAMYPLHILSLECGTADQRGHVWSQVCLLEVSAATQCAVSVARPQLVPAGPGALVHCATRGNELILFNSWRLGDFGCVSSCAVGRSVQLLLHLHLPSPEAKQSSKKHLYG